MKILIADDHKLFRDAMVALIKKNKVESQINCASSFDEAIEIIEDSESKHDVVILDLNMPGMRGVTGIKNFCDKFPKIPVILLSGMASKNEIGMSLEMGASGFIPKTMAGDSVINAISIVANGDKFIHPSYYEKDSLDNLGKSNISPREREVLDKLFLGGSNKDIANILNIKEVTVKLHISSLFDKFKAKNRTDLIIKALKQGFGN